MSTATNSAVLPEIVNAVRQGECILFLGAMASAPAPATSTYKYPHAPPGGAELARRIAIDCQYPDDDKTNLQRVALYAEFRPFGSREQLVRVTQKAIRQCGYCTEDVDIEPSPALHMLAALPFRIIITTNYDALFDDALRNARTTNGRKKRPILRIYNPARKEAPEEVPIDPTELEPILLKLHGDLQKPESIVITEEDYITFIQRMASAQLHPIHEYIRTRMRAWPFLFVGYSLKDYNLRLLFRTLRWGMPDAQLPLSYSVDPSPDDLIVAVWQRGERKMVSFVEQNLWDFVPALYANVMGAPFPP